MAAGTLLNAVTTNTTGSGASHAGPCTVFVRGTFDGAKVSVQVADSDTSAYYQNVRGDQWADGVLTGPGQVTINCLGTYYVRCKVTDAGSSTSITAVSTQ